MKFWNRTRGIARDVGVGYVVWGTASLLVNLHLGKITLFVVGLVVFIVGVVLLGLSLSGDSEK